MAVPRERDAQPVPRCGTCTADLYACAEWRRQGQIETVGMESTGVYGMAWVAGLEERGLDVQLGDPHRVRPGPGRKTDVQDCPWLPALHPEGLLRGALRPEDALCVLRSDLRQRRMLVALASRAVPPMQKALEQMHRKRTEVGRASMGQPGMTSMRALLAGERTPQRVAPSRDKRGKPAQATIAKAVAGHWRAAQRCAWAQAMALRLAAQGVAHRHSALGA